MRKHCMPPAPRNERAQADVRCGTLGRRVGVRARMRIARDSRTSRCTMRTTCCSRPASTQCIATRHTCCACRGRRVHARCVRALASCPIFSKTIEAMPLTTSRDMVHQPSSERSGARSVLRAGDARACGANFDCTSGAFVRTRPAACVRGHLSSCRSMAVHLPRKLWLRGGCAAQHAAACPGHADHPHICHSAAINSTALGSSRRTCQASPACACDLALTCPSSASLRAAARRVCAHDLEADSSRLISFSSQDRALHRCASSCIAL